jgi:NAD(P)-dependent dehydrogenase (short-subunit alcohol dehydrogenase family)
LDVTDAGQIAAAVEIVRAKIAAGGRLHAIINNAGAQWAGPIETMPLTEWRSQFDVTLLRPDCSYPAAPSGRAICFDEKANDPRNEMVGDIPVEAACTAWRRIQDCRVRPSTESRVSEIYSGKV